MMKKLGADFKKGLILSVILAVWLRLFLTVIGADLSYYFQTFPLTTKQMDLSELIPRKENNLWYRIASSFHRFDGFWYEAVSRTDYKGLPKATPFFPLYPRSVAFFSGLFKMPFFAGSYVLNTLFTACAFFFLYRLVRLDYNERIARRAVFLFALFPSSFFLLAPYAEPLLFSFFFLSIIFARKNKLFLSTIAGILGSITKPYGFMIVIPLIVYAWNEKNIKIRVRRIIHALMIPTGTIAVLFYQNLMLARNGLAINEGISGWGMKWVNPIVPIYNSILFFLRNPFDLPNDLNLFSVCLITYFLYACRKKIDRSYWIYTLILFLFFIMYQPTGVPLKSFSRYFLTLFPVFIGLATFRTNTLINVIYITTSLALMVVFFIFYTFGFFVF